MIQVLVLLIFVAAFVVNGSEIPQPEDALPARQQRVVGLALAGLGVAQALKPLAAAAAVTPLILSNFPTKSGNTGPANEIVIVDGSFPRGPGVINPAVGSAVRTPIQGVLGPFVVTGRRNTENAESAVQPATELEGTPLYLPSFYSALPLSYVYRYPYDFVPYFVPYKF